MRLDWKDVSENLLQFWASSVWWLWWRWCHHCGDDGARTPSWWEWWWQCHHTCTSDVTTPVAVMAQCQNCGESGGSDGTVSEMWWEWWWWLPPPGGLTVTLLTLVTFLQWNDLNRVKDDGERNIEWGRGGGPGESVMKWEDSYAVGRHWCPHTCACPIRPSSPLQHCWPLSLMLCFYYHKYVYSFNSGQCLLHSCCHIIDICVVTLERPSALLSLSSQCHWPPFSSIQVRSLTRRILILKSHNFTKPASTLLLLIHLFVHHHLPP